SYGICVCFACRVQAVPSGDISVMPQACTTCTRRRSIRVSIIAGGQAEPPITVRRKVENRKSLVSTWLIRPSQTVGTPAEKVTPSASNNSYSDLPSSAGPGNTSLAPDSGTEYGKPQAFTWNIGTTGSTTSALETFKAFGSAEA